MRNLLKLFLLLMLILPTAAAAQRLDDILATSTNINFTAASLSERGRTVYLEQRNHLSHVRTDVFNEMVADAVLELESKALRSTPDKLLAAKRSAVRPPTEAEIQKTYNDYSSVLAGRKLEDVRGELAKMIKQRDENEAIEKYIKALRTKHKAVVHHDVNAPGLRATDVVATVGTRKITFSEFEQANKVRLKDAEFEIYEELISDLGASMLNALATEEAKERNIDASAYIAAEITDKLRLFTEEERATVQNALRERLFAKYKVKVVLPEPVSIVQNVAVEADDPQLGTAAAAVTVIMFTDLQCPACARTHPVLKQVLAEYGDKVRFVVRDFPLVSIHKDAFPAALAANAARRQGKFFEYAEILYRNQDALGKPALTKYAAQLGLNAKQFELDFSDARTAAEVRKDMTDARRHGVNSTPTIFVNGVKVHRLSADGFRRAIDRALSK
jgi:protein-disulfide isomerase